MRLRQKSCHTAFLAAAFSLVLSLGLASGLYAAPVKQAPAPGDAHYQAWLTQEVHHRLVMIPWLSVFDNLEYKVEGDKVTLMGQVVRPVTKSDAASAVKGIEGVQGVDNQIEVLPLSPNDDRIRHAEFRAIYSFPSLQKYAWYAVQSIHIIVKNGHVTLEGYVDNQADKDAANIRANSVSGVFSVTNNLRVQKSS